jgi:hypothetical protein
LPICRGAVRECPPDEHNTQRQRRPKHAYDA